MKQILFIFLSLGFSLSSVAFANLDEHKKDPCLSMVEGSADAMNRISNMGMVQSSYPRGSITASVADQNGVEHITYSVIVRTHLKSSQLPKTYFYTVEAIYPDANGNCDLKSTVKL